VPHKQNRLICWFFKNHISENARQRVKSRRIIELDGSFVEDESFEVIDSDSSDCSSNSIAILSGSSFENLEESITKTETTETELVLNYFFCWIKPFLGVDCFLISAKFRPTNKHAITVRRFSLLLLQYCSLKDHWTIFENFYLRFLPQKEILISIFINKND